MFFIVPQFGHLEDLSSLDLALSGVKGLTISQNANSLCYSILYKRLYGSYFLEKNLINNMFFTLQIARQESVNTDLTTLSSLCEKTDNDIRSCLNTLQVR